MNRTMTFYPAAITAETAHLPAREFGVLMRLAMYFWEVDEVPRTAAAIAKVAGIDIRAAEAMRPRLLKFFERAETFAILQQVRIARYTRRANAGRLGGLRARSKTSSPRPVASA